MAQISVLYLEEAVQFDRNQIRRLYKFLGNADAQAAMTAAVRDISGKLADAERLFTARAWTELKGCLHTLAAAADQIGLATLSDACHATQIAAERQDQAATAATLYRALRIADRVMTDIRLLCDTPG